MCQNKTPLRFTKIITFSRFIKIVIPLGSTEFRQESNTIKMRQESNTIKMRQDSNTIKMRQDNNCQGWNVT